MTQPFPTATTDDPAPVLEWTPDWNESFTPSAAEVSPPISPWLPMPVLYYDAKSQDIPILTGMGIPAESIRVLNPLDRRCVRWDIGRDVQSLTDITMLAHILAPEPPPHVKEEGFFRNASIRLLKGVIERLHYASPGAWDLRDIVLAFESLDTLTALLSSDSRTAKYISGLGTDGTSQNILATVVAAIHEYDIIAALYSHAADSISLRDWLHDHSVLVLGFSHEAKTTLNALNRALLAMAFKLILDLPRSPDPRVLVLLDELPQLGRLEGLKDVATLGREKGAVLALGLQSMEDLRRIYGAEEAEVITGQMNQKAILRLAETRSADWASGLFGKVRRLRRQFNYQWQSFAFGFLNFGQRVGGQDHEVLEEVVMPSELLTIPPINRQGKQGLSGYYLSGQVNYYHTYPLAFLDQALHPADDSMAAFLPAPSFWQALSPWDAEDYSRLGFYSPTHPPSSARERWFSQAGVAAAPPSQANGNTTSSGGAIDPDPSSSFTFLHPSAPLPKQKPQPPGKDKDKGKKQTRPREPDRR